MQVRVLFFGQLKDIVGRSADKADLPEGATLADLLIHYSGQTPRLKEFLPAIALSLNQEYAAPSSRLRENDEVALLPPVSGGAPAETAAMPRVQIVRAPIDSAAVIESLKASEDGATLTFEGIVRNNTRGRKTLYLDYESYEQMALKQMQELIQQSLEQFKVRDAAIVHRLGRLEIGETSVLIVVSSAHRGAAFDACRWLIDNLKKSVPIWKKEYFEDGAVWADGESFPAEIPRANS